MQVKETHPLNYRSLLNYSQASQVVLMVKKLLASADTQETVGLIPGLGRSPGVGNGNPVYYSYLEISIGRGAWWATVHQATKSWIQLSTSDQISRSVCPTLCDPMNHSTPSLPVHHQLLEFTETHVHRVSDAIQPSHPLSSPDRKSTRLNSSHLLLSRMPSSA